MSNLSDYLDYAEKMEVSSEVLNWMETTLSNYLEKNNPEITEVEHVIDYLTANEVKKISLMSYPQAVKKAEKWTLKLQKEASKIKETSKDTKIIHDFGDGFKIVQLVGKNAYEREGKLMRHCLASYYGKNIEIYSLRDKNNNPHCTMEKDQQIKGKGNGSIHPKYIAYVVKFLELSGMQVRDSEMKHLGYVNITDIKDKNAVFNDLFQGKYFYKQNKILDKKGNLYQSMNLWKKFNIFDLDTKLKIKWNFDIDLSVKTFIASLKKNKGKHLIGDYSAASNTGYYSAASNTGDYSAASNTGYYSAASNTGDYSAAITTGNYSAAITTGNYSAAITTGDYSAASNTGNYSAASNTGNYSAASNIGNYSAASNTGNYSAAITTGNYSAASNIGDYSAASNTGYRSAASNTGDYSAASNTGNYSAASNTGDYSAASNTGNYSAASNTGDYSAASNTGDYSAASNIGDYSAASNTGYRSAASNTGDYSAASNIGDYSAASNTGDYSAASNTGDYSAAITTGDRSKSEVKKKSSIAISTGKWGKAKGCLNSWITLVERDDNWNILYVKSAKIDGKKLKKNTWYCLKNNKFKKSRPEDE